MQRYDSLQAAHLDRSWVTVGTFDGVHLGHQKIIRGLVDHAHQNDRQAVVVTFHPHPTLVLGGKKKLFYLTLPEKRVQLFGALGVDGVIIHPFTRQVAEESAERFISRLKRHLGMERLWVGYDFALGKNREGNAQKLHQLGKTYDYELHQVPPYQLDGEVVSSSFIRGLLQEGRVQEASRYLGRLFEVAGVVVGGDRRGKRLGFPTANLDVPQEMARVKPGVYACYVMVGEEQKKAVTNVGFRPTFHDPIDLPLVETHILDFSGDLYGDELEIRFHTLLREERKFASVPDLKGQIRQDVAHTRDILGR
ncbi:MAG: bifunctional riboflavin kinase/FAD synthetase [Anaerolineales bacterium]